MSTAEGRGSTIDESRLAAYLMSGTLRSHTSSPTKRPPAQAGSPRGAGIDLSGAVVT
jgi:hypothetical protein